jgi:hypothetical protein
LIKIIVFLFLFLFFELMICGKVFHASCIILICNCFFNISPYVLCIHGFDGVIFFLFSFCIIVQGFYCNFNAYYFEFYYSSTTEISSHISCGHIFYSLQIGHRMIPFSPLHLNVRRTHINIFLKKKYLKI